jgi:hypothetical protein
VQRRGGRVGAQAGGGQQGERQGEEPDGERLRASLTDVGRGGWFHSINEG